MIRVISKEGRHGTARHPFAHEGDVGPRRRANKRYYVGRPQALPDHQFMKIRLSHPK
jgi:hypothetical protein